MIYRRLLSIEYSDDARYYLKKAGRQSIMHIFLRPGLRALFSNKKFIIFDVKCARLFIS